MSKMIKKENITIVIGEYEKDGQTKKQFKTIGEIVTMAGDDGQPYQFGRLWGPGGVVDIKIYSADNNQQGQQQGQGQQQQQGSQQQGQQQQGGYQQQQPSQQQQQPPYDDIPY